LGLDPGFVCEAMFSAASGCLHEYSMDVVFVIYPSNDADDNEQEENECYQVISLESITFSISSFSVCFQIGFSNISR
jgi:hypothetical protein